MAVEITRQNYLCGIGKGVPLEDIHSSDEEDETDEHAADTARGHTQKVAAVPEHAPHRNAPRSPPVQAAAPSPVLSWCGHTSEQLLRH